VDRVVRGVDGEIDARPGKKGGKDPGNCGVWNEHVAVVDIEVAR
jgi:hypothetical protein